MKDRSRDDRRSVGSHQKMMGALGKAAGGWASYTDQGLRFAVKPASDGMVYWGEHPHTAVQVGRSSAVRYNQKDAVKRAISSVTEK